jgi:hypothetical protein
MRLYRTPMRGFRGLGQTYQTVSTAAGDYQVVTAPDGTVTTFDPSGNIVSGVAVGPLQAGQSALAFSASINPSGSTAPASLASLFPGMTGNTTVAGVSVPSWLVPVALIAGAFFVYKAFGK